MVTNDSDQELEEASPATMAGNGNDVEDDRKRVLFVGAGAASMSTAHHLPQHPEKFAVTLTDAVGYCGGPPMIVLPNFCEFGETSSKALVSRGVTMKLSTELTEVVLRNKQGVAVRLKPRTPVPDAYNPVGGDTNAPVSEEAYDEIVPCCLADTAKRVLGRTATWKEKKGLGEDAAVGKLDGMDQSSRLSFAVHDYRPMYYIKIYPGDKSKLQMCFDTTNYQCQYPEKVPFEQHIFQAIYLNKDRDRKLWSDHEIREDRIIRKDWWHQLCNSYTHCLFVAPCMMFLQAKNHTRFAAEWTLVNAHEVTVISGIAAAVAPGAEYPEDLENDGFAFLCFRLYYLLACGKWYRRKYTKNQRQPTARAAKAGSSRASGLYGSMCKGPGVATVERRTWWRRPRKAAAPRI
ncbi:hypothetical protein DL768_007865 [Monosporascus sp. mg162]|nr:hypothetical protein DL768_007865 [Monosporascus sp. mg162]